MHIALFLKVTYEGEANILSLSRTFLSHISSASVMIFKRVEPHRKSKFCWKEFIFYTVSLGKLLFR